MTAPSGAVGRGVIGGQDAGGKIELNPSAPTRTTGETRWSAPCPGHPALADLVLELDEQAALRLAQGRSGTGGEIRVTGEVVVVTGMAGEELDLVGRATPADLGEPAVGPGAEDTPRWRRAPQRGQAPPGDGEPQAGAEPVAEPPDDGQRRERD